VCKVLVVQKCPRHFDTGAEVSRRHYDDFYGGAEMSWVRNVLGPTCPYTLSSSRFKVKVTWL